MAGSRWLIMGVLAVLTVFFSVQGARIWLRPLQAHVTAAPDAESGNDVAPPVVKQRKAPKSAFEVIATRSLFGQSRTEGETETPVGNLKQAESSRYAKKIGLFGVVINDGEKMALVNKDIGRRGADELLWVRIGDRIEQVKVVGIERDRILLQENNSHYEILLSDQRHSDKQKKPGKETGPRIISTESETGGEPAEKPKTPKIRVKSKQDDDNAED